MTGAAQPANRPVPIVACRLLGLAAGVLAAAVLARWLGPDRFGEWQFIVSVAAVISVLLSTGLPIVIRRDGLPQDGGAHPVRGTDPLPADRAVSLQYWIALALVAGSAVPALGIMLALESSTGREGLLLACAWGLGGAILAVTSNQLRARFLPVQAELAMIAGASGPPVLVVAAFALTDEAGNAAGDTAFLAFCGLSVAINGVIAVYVGRMVKARTGGRAALHWPTVRLASLDLVRRASAFFPLVLVFGLIHYGSSIALGLVAEQAEVGFYNIALTLSTALIALITAYYASVGPQLSLAYKTEDWAAFLVAFRQSRKVGLFLVALSVTMAVAFGPTFVATVYGAEYQRAYDYLLLLLLPIAVSLPFGAISETLQMTGRQAVEAKIRFAQLLVSVGLAALGYWIDGPWGLVLGFVAARCLAALALNVYFYVWFFPGITTRYRLA